jgi:hypothetical protein
MECKMVEGLIGDVGIRDNADVEITVDPAVVSERGLSDIVRFLWLSEPLRADGSFFTAIKQDAYHMSEILAAAHFLDHETAVKQIEDVFLATYLSGIAVSDFLKIVKLDKPLSDEEAATVRHAFPWMSESYLTALTASEPIE